MFMYCVVGNDSDDEGNRTSENQQCSNNDVNVIVNHTGMNVRENNYNDENDEFDANDSEDSYDSEESYEENRSCSEQNSSENDSDDDDIDIIDTDTEYDTDSESCSDDDGWEYSDNGSDCGSYSDCDDSDCSSYGSLGSEIQSDCRYSCSGRNGENYDSADDSDYTDGSYDDLRIASGTATTYKLPKGYANIFDSSDSQLIELPKIDEDDEECPQLVAIDINRDAFLAKEAIHAARRQKHDIESKAQAERCAADYAQKLRDYYDMDNEHDCLNGGTGSLSAVSATPRLIECSQTDFRSKRFKFDGVADVDFAAKVDICLLTFPKITPKSCLISSVNRSVPTTKPMISHDDSILSTNQTHNSRKFDEPNPMATQKTRCISNETQAPTKTGTSLQLPNTQSKFFNAINSRHVLLLLRNTIYFHGNLKIKLIAGSATIFGYHLQLNKFVTVNSPRGHGTIFIQSLPSNQSNNQSNLAGLDALVADFYSHDILAIREQFITKSDAILLLERDMENKGILMIDRYMRETMLPNINAFNSNREFYSSEFVLHAKFSHRPNKGLVLNHQWSLIGLQKNSKVVTIGGKGVGKSTYQRYAINSNLLNLPKFVFIDLDIGQPELFVPQTLSVHMVTEPILGPGYLRSIKPVKSIFFGDITVQSDPIKYLQCVLDIYTFCATNTELRNLPWIVNTMGYSRGLGNELIACILKIFQPSDVVQIQSHDQLRNFDHVMTAELVNTWQFNIFGTEMKRLYRKCNYRMHVLDTIVGDQQVNRKPDMSSADHRFAMILSKLSECMKSNSDWLSSVRPFEVSLRDLHIVMPNYKEIDETEHLDILSGSLVYMCNKTTDNSSVDCYGIGIVRSVDKTTDKLYVISTIPLDELGSVNALGIGSIPLPSIVLLNQHSHIHGNVPYVYNSNNFIGSKQVAHHQYRAIGNQIRRP